MSYIHRTDQIDLQHTCPVGWRHIPKGETKLPRTHTDAKNDVIHLLKSSRKSLHGFKVSHISLGDEVGSLLTIKTQHAAALCQKACGNGATNTVSCADDGN